MKRHPLALRAVMKRMALSSLLIAAVSVISKQMRRRVDGALLELLDDEGEEALLADRLAGEVDGEEDGPRPLAPLRLGEGGEGGLHHPAVDRGDQVVALGGGDEGRRARSPCRSAVEHADEDLAEEVARGRSSPPSGWMSW